MPCPSSGKMGGDDSCDEVVHLGPHNTVFLPNSVQDVNHAEGVSGGTSEANCDQQPINHAATAAPSNQATSSKVKPRLQFQLITQIDDDDKVIGSEWSRASLEASNGGDAGNGRQLIEEKERIVIPEERRCVDPLRIETFTCQTVNYTQERS